MKLDQSTEERLTSLQSLEKHPGYGLLMDWIDEMTRGSFLTLLAEKDPTVLAKLVGMVSAYKTVRSRVNFEITTIIDTLNQPVE